MVWAFHARFNAKKNHQVCQECLLDARWRGEKRIAKQPTIPCETHGVPVLWPENDTAWQLWGMASNQVMLFHTANPKQPLIELNFAALIPLIQLYVEERHAQQQTLEKIVLCHRIAQSKGVFDFFK